MSDASLPLRPSRRRAGWSTRLLSSPSFQRWAARFPLTRRIARKDGEALMDLVSGFVRTQVLLALVELGTLDLLKDGPRSLRRIAHAGRLPEGRARILCKAGAAVGLLRIKGDTVSLARRGAALTGVPGLAEMIRHNATLYRDLTDPAAFFRGETETELARFWPYVFGPGAAEDPETADRYSRLMAESQTLIAEETLDAVSLSRTRHLLDVGGGTGAFLTAALQRAPEMRGTLFDLPAVAGSAGARFAQAGLKDRADILPGCFRTDPLPDGADTVSLVRVLYDHSDDTVSALLKKVAHALPEGGRVIVSEPMSGGTVLDRSTDTYFAIYTLAMGTGKTRSPDEIRGLLASSGFRNARQVRTRRPFITSVVVADR